MKFIVSSSELLAHLQTISKVVSSKSTLPILDHFLFDLSDGVLTLTASDLESTLITKMSPENIEGSGTIAIEAKRLTDILREFPEQPLTFEIDSDTLQVNILSENGKFSVIGMYGDEFPKIPELNQEKLTSITMQAEVLSKGVNKTLFATANDELRPVMNGIFFQIATDSITFVASDSHKLVRYKRSDANSDQESSFILPKKPATFLKNIIPSSSDEVTIEFDDKNAIFTIQETKLVCRLTEGQFPNYQAVIPVDNPNKIIIDRLNLMNSLKRVSVFSSQSSNLIKLQISNDHIVVSAQDIDFSISAYENINGQYSGEEIKIGFKSVFLIDILSNMSCKEVVLELADSAKAGLILPFDKNNESEDELMLLMPMTLN